MSTTITTIEEPINIVVNDEKISINVASGDVIVNVTENIVEVSTVNGGYPLPTTVYSVFGRTGNIIAVDGDYDLGELGDVTLVSSINGDVLTYDGTKWINKAVTGTGTVTSVNMTVPVGLQVSGNPITVAGTLAVNFASGYSLPTTAKQTTWDAAYNDSIVSASVSGTTTKTLTLNQQDGGTITASWTDIDTNLVTSVNGYVGTVVLTTTDIAEGTRLYYTETRVSNNVDVAANTAARHSAVTIGTANGLSLASQVLSLALASASTTGALSSTDWVKFNTAYNDSIVSASVSGTTTKTLTLTQQDAGTITASWTDLAASGTVTSVGASVPTGLTISGSPIVSAGTLAFGLSAGYTIPLSTQLVPTGGTAGQLLTKNSATNYDTAWMDNYADWTEQLRDTVKAEVAINKGQAVYISGANGTNQLVSLASNTTEPLSSKTLGLAMQNLAINGIGAIITEGLLGGLNTSTATAGDPVWLGVSGNLIYGLANKPIAPAHLVYIGVVTRVNSSNGEIYVKIQNGFELQELHNVLISSVANNEGLFYESATTLWKNKSIATVLGYTPISLTSLSGVSPLSYNNTTGAFTIAQATTSANGYLSSTDWNIFNGKQSAGNYITALSGEATASGPGSAAVTLSTPAVTGKLLTGVNITGGSITATDSILVAFGKIQNQINGVLGGAIYQSVWNASTNSPTLTSGTGTKGYYYIVSVAGATNLDGITDWQVGDWAIFNGTVWNKVDNTDAVSSVNGFTGSVSLTTSNITEGTRLYYTEARVSANTDVAANTAVRHAAVTIGTANGLSLSTQALSLGLASTSATGALSSTDWNTFNLKQAALSGTGFVKISGSTISYDNSTYLTTSAASSTYLPLAGGTLTGPLGGTSISMSGVGQFQGYTLSGDFGANYTIGLGVGMPGSSPGKGLNFGWNNVANFAFIGAVQNGTAWQNINIAPVGGAVGIGGVDATYKFYVNGTLGVIGTSNFSAAITATSFIKTSGTSSQFLKADGSVDSSTYLTTSGTAANSTLWNNQSYFNTTGVNVQYLLCYDNVNSVWRPSTIAQVQTWLGLGSNAYTSTAYLPLAGGTLTGPLNGTKFAFSISSNSDWAGSIDNLGTTGANGFYVNIGASSTGVPFAVYKNFSQLFKIANDGALSAISGKFSSTLEVNGSQSYFGSTKGFIYFVEDQINCYYSSNAAATLAVNYYGYNQGLTQFRSFDIYNGKGVRIINIDGTTSITNFYGAATFTSTVDASQFNGNVVVGSATVGGKVKFNYGANAASRSYIIVSDAYNFGDLGFQQSTTQTGSTYANKMILAANGDLTLGSVPSTGTGTLYAAVGSFSGQVNGSSGAAFSGQVTAGGYTASGDFGAGYTINGAIGISAKGVNIGWNTTNDCGFIGTVHNGTAWKNLALVPVAGALLVGTAVAATGLLQVSGTVYATGFYESSDIRFKNILETNPNINVSGIDVIKFTRKDKDIDQVRFGYSAQQVQSILPDVVTGNEFLNVNYLDVHTLKIAALEQEIKDLKAKMN